MTTELIDNLRRLHTESTDEEDKAILGAWIALEEAEDNGEQNDEKQRCAKCKRMLPPGKLDGDGVCGYCLLDALYIRQRNWRKSHYLEY